MSTPDPVLLAEVLRHALDGVAIVEGGGGAPRILYVNATLAGLLRHPEEWPIGRVLGEIETEAPADPNATSIGIGQRVRLHRADGTSVDCERWAVLLSDARMALHYRPLPRSAPGALAAAMDRSSGLSTPEHLVEVFRRDWSIAQRDGRAMCLMRFEVDGCRDYLDVFGRGATESVLRQVGRTIAAAMRRSGDVVARLADGEYMALAVTMEPEAGRLHAERIVGRVRELAILHPRSPSGRYLTLSAGVVSAIPPRDVGYEALIEAVQRAAAQARARGGNQAVAGSLAPPG